MVDDRAVRFNDSSRRDSARLRGRVQASRKPVGRVVTSAPPVREPIKGPTGTAPTGFSYSPPAPAPRDTPSPNIQAPTVSAPRPRSIDWRDASFNAQIAAIDRALRDFETGLQTRGQRYGQDYLTGLRRLGFRAEEGFVPIGAVGEQVAQPGVRALAAGAEPQRVRGDFDYEGAYDPFSAAARGTRSARDEFAARGTLRSTDFNRSFEEFQNRLNQQLEGMETGRSRFRQDLETELAQQRATAEERRGSAQRDAMMRAAIAAASQAGF
jgi:hypothetical protein